MNLFRSIKLNNWIMILACLAILLTALALFYFLRIFFEYAMIKDATARKSFVFDSIVNVKFISFLVAYALSYLMLPIFFLVNNFSTFNKRWLFTVICFIILLFNLQLFLALFCMVCYIVQFTDEFKEYREQHNQSRQ
jgi:uncharacterized membrane protein